MPSILVVDDEQPLRGWQRHLLEAKGYHVEEAVDGKEALALIDRHQPALMILDMYMRDMDGLEVIMRLQSRAQPVKVLPIFGNAVVGFDTCQTEKTLGAHDALANRSVRRSCGNEWQPCLPTRDGTNIRPLCRLAHR
jgi:CheY-like chemotaxis protein